MPRFDLEDFLRLVQNYRRDPGPGGPADRAGPGPAPGRAQIRPVQPAPDHLGRRPARRRPGLRMRPARLGCPVKQGYGMTELGGATHLVPDSGGGDPESIGPLLPGIECRVIDCASGRDAGPGQPGRC